MGVVSDGIPVVLKTKLGLSDGIRLTVLEVSFVLAAVSTVGYLAN